MGLGAGLWTSGLAGFARALSNDPQVKASSLADLRHSLLSPDVTHVSTAERIALLNDTVRLATPKLRYFALSLALAFILPLNPYTPLIEGGAFDHLFIAAAVVVMHVAAVSMVISSAFALNGPFGWRPVALLAAFLCIATILPKVNLYEFGYLLTNSVVRMVLPGGFGGDAQTWESIASDIATTFRGLHDKFVSASGGVIGTLIAIVCAAISLRVLSVLTRRVQPFWFRTSSASRSRSWHCRNRVGV
jgi:hypothetical protein